MLGGLYPGQNYLGQGYAGPLSDVVTADLSITEPDDIISAEVALTLPEEALTLAGATKAWRDRVRKKKQKEEEERRLQELEGVEVAPPAPPEPKRVIMRRAENLGFEPFTYSPKPPVEDKKEPKKAIKSEKIVERVIEIRTVYPKRIVRKKVWIVRKGKPVEHLKPKKKVDFDYDKLLEMINFMEAV